MPRETLQTLTEPMYYVLLSLVEPRCGIEIMERYNLTPCREVGILKNDLKDAILDGVIGNNREEAIAFLDEKAKILNIKL